MPREVATGSSNIGVVSTSQQIEDTIAYCRHILGGMAGADVAGIFAERDITHPMQAIFDLPMPAPQGLQGGRSGLRWRLTGERVVPFLRRFPTASATDVLDFSMNATDLLNGGPIQMGNDFAADLQGAAFFAVAMPINGNVAFTGGVGVSKTGLHRLPGSRAIAF